MKRPNILSASFVKTVKEPGRYGDGRGSHGLSLLVKEMSNGRISKSWSQRVIINGKPNMIGIGSYPVISLAEARQRCLENKQALVRGIDPRAAVPTFEEAAEEVIQLHAPGWKDGGKSEIHWRASLRDYAYPTLANKRVDQINTADLFSVLTPHWQTKQATMKKVQQRIGIVMRWSVAKGYREGDPSAALSAALPKNGAVTQHQKSLHHSEVGAALAKIRQSGAYWATKACFEFLTLTAVRSKEARLAKWSEISFKSKTWTIPADRMKMKREHRVPLSDQALEILAEAVKHADNSGLVFPSVRGKVISDQIVSGLTRDNGIEGTPHGMRSSFRNWCAECTDAPREVCELALAHVNSDRVEAAYMRSDLYDKRRELMDQWADYIYINNLSCG